MGRLKEVPTNAIMEAASVLLTRGPGSPELFLVRRADHLRFFGGFWAFPGGKVAATDAEVAVVPGSADLPPQQALRCVAAARELFEETGVLIARRPDGSFPRAGPELSRLQGELTAAQLTFPALLQHLGAAVHAGDFHLIGAITTPPFSTIRFDTTFFVAHLPAGQDAAVYPGELAEGRWASAADVLGQWTRGECLLSPPSVMSLEAVRGRPVEEAPIQLAPLFAELAAGRIHPIYFAPAVQLIPLHTASLPPTNYTNAYFLGSGPFYLIDPGPTDAAEQQRLFDLLDAHAGHGHHLTAVVLTHHHPDHIGAAAACAERYRVPMWAHAWTAQALRGRVEVTRALDDGDRLDLGACPDGSGPWRLEALHTPGHAPGHLAFYEPHYRLLLAGDMVSTLSSIVIVPPSGDLAVYLDSLRRLQTYDCRLLLPSHGTASSRPQETLREAVAHRVKREQQLLAALSPAPRTIGELAPELYKGTPAALMPLAEKQLLAGLQKLQREKRVEAKGEGLAAVWSLRPGDEQ